MNSSTSNPRVNCKSSVIPYLDLSKWADHPGAHNLVIT